MQKLICPDCNDPKKGFIKMTFRKWYYEIYYCTDNGGLHIGPEKCTGIDDDGVLWRECNLCSREFSYDEIEDLCLKQAKESLASARC